MAAADDENEHEDVRPILQPWIQFTLHIFSEKRYMSKDTPNVVLLLKAGIENGLISF